MNLTYKRSESGNYIVSNGLFPVGHIENFGKNGLLISTTDFSKCGRKERTSFRLKDAKKIIESLLA